MINSSSLDCVNAQRWLSHYLKPAYGSYCFSQIPGTIRRLFIPEDGSLSSLPDDVLPNGYLQYEAVVTIFLDAFGWRFLEQHLPRSHFLRRFKDNGRISKLTSQFPSTTSAHLTTLHTGRPVHESGIFEWHYYEPLAESVIKPILFSYVQDPERDTLLQAKIDPIDIFGRGTSYQYLQGKGIDSFVFQYQGFTPSTYSDAMFRGAHITPYDSFSNGLTLLSHAITQAKRPAHFFIYFDKIDAVSHQHGPESSETFAIIAETLDNLETFAKSLNAKDKKTLLIVTADHGQIAADPNQALYLDELCPDLKRMIRKDPRSGRQLVPAGNPRDFTLYLEPQYISEAKEMIAEKISHVATVWTCAEMIAAGIFGPSPSPRFFERYGDLACLPFSSVPVWWSEQGKYKTSFLGDHGGLTPPEMETIFLTLQMH